MISGTPYRGLDEIGLKAYIEHPPYTLVAYANTRNSLGLGTVVTDLIIPNVINGYSPILLTLPWTCVNGEVLYPVKPRWTATGPWSHTVTGVAMIYNAIVQHFSDLSTADFVAVNGGYLEVDLQTIV
jgi:hypothetical protein